MSTTAEPHQERNTGLIWMFLAYVSAIAAAFGTLLMVPHQPIWLQILLADVVGTIVIFSFSVAFNNSSFYDPYWSVAPMFISVFLAAQGQIDLLANPRGLWVFSLVMLWGARLTLNFLLSWKGLFHEDWRYRSLRAQNGKWYWWISFGGIHFFPTVLVYLGSLSMIPVLQEVGKSGGHLFWLDIIALAVTLGAIVLETVADEQMRKFRKSDDVHKGAVMDKGVWAWSRHPNYFGEASFWIGLALFAVAADPGGWYYFAWGPLVMVGLFVFISIPMMEKKQLKEKPTYAAYQKRVSAFFPMPPKRPKKPEA